MSQLTLLLKECEAFSQSQRDKGTSFEHLTILYLQNEPVYKDQYREVLTYADWSEKYQAEFNLPNKKDVGIDLVATTRTGEHHAVQCKNYKRDETIKKSHIDSFLSASGKSYFSYRLIVSTVSNWSDNAIEMLNNPILPIAVINFQDLEKSQIDWGKFRQQNRVVLKTKKTLLPHQENALSAVAEGLSTAERGKLIMACGTGKTFTSLKIAETLAGKGKRVLFLVPSLALLSQTLGEWTQEANIPLHNFAVCSDSDVGKKKGFVDDDQLVKTTSDLQFPATTNAKSLSERMKIVHDDNHMTVVYATYHSIGVLSKAQQDYDVADFDLIICDEAHRTTGATFDGDDESAFVKIHDNIHIRAKKRLYMTATPRIYGEQAKAETGVELCSMDDKNLYGNTLFTINFSEAVSLGLLVDYKVIVLAVEESHVSRQLQSLLKDDNNQLKVDDAAKIVGCWKALAKQGLSDSLGDDYQPMQRAVAFCQVIDKEYKGKKHKVSSKQIAEMFSAVVNEYQQAEIAEWKENNPNQTIEPSLLLNCDAQHVDGSMNASEKQDKLDWLKADLSENTCRILSNVRCLSEGVDVPSLDAVLFLTPRSSQVDVVQSVGRVMRRAPNKKQGYVILPVVIPAGVEPSAALDDNVTYRVV